MATDATLNDDHDEDDGAPSSPAPEIPPQHPWADGRAQASQQVPRQYGPPTGPGYYGAQHPVHHPSAARPGYYDQAYYTEPYPSRGHYAEPYPSRGHYTEGYYTQGQYVQGQYTQSQYTQGQYTQSQYAQYDQSHYDVDETPREGNGAAVASCVLAILGLLLSLRPLVFGSNAMAPDTYVALGISVVALVLGVVGARVPRRRPATVVGIALSLLALLLIAVIPTL